MDKFVAQGHSDRANLFVTSAEGFFHSSNGRRRSLRVSDSLLADTAEGYKFCSPLVTLALVVAECITHPIVHNSFGFSAKAGQVAVGLEEGLRGRVFRHHVILFAQRRKMAAYWGWIQSRSNAAPPSVSRKGLHPKRLARPGPGQRSGSIGTWPETVRNIQFPGLPRIADLI
jgi:hypothetical protein